MHIKLLSITVFLLCTLCAQAAHAQRAQFADQVDERVSEILTGGADDERGAIRSRHQQLLSLANYVSAHAGPRQTDAMVRCEGALGVFGLVVGSGVQNPSEVLANFGSHPNFATELGLLVKPEDKSSNVVALADQLMRQRSAQVERYPALAAALCVVHDDQKGGVLERRINENTPKAADPLDIFDYFVSNASMLPISPDRLPALALVYVVDVTETPQQMRWALNRYRSNPMIGERFFEIEYDYNHFQQNKPKRVSAEPGDYNLEKIKRHGGVCADQAYFAMSVAKACGIPSAYVRANGADVSHAWVGFVESRGRRSRWNFDAGRYEQYQKLRGNLLDPQTEEWVSDGRVGLLGGAMSATNAQVLATLASARVVQRMRGGEWSTTDSIELDSRGNLRSARTDSVEDQLALLRSTLNNCAGVPRAWDQVIALAEANKLDEKQMDVWARAVMQIAGREHQDFAYDFMMQLIVTIDEPERQHELLEWAFNQFRARPDLAAGVRFQQGYLWSMNENLEFAWLAYQDVVDKFINEGPMVVTALTAMQFMLSENGKQDMIIPILENAIQRVERPRQMSSQFAVQSNFYRINMQLAEAYERAGRNQDAQRIRRMLGE